MEASPGKHRGRKLRDQTNAIHWQSLRSIHLCVYYLGDYIPKISQGSIRAYTRSAAKYSVSRAVSEPHKNTFRIAQTAECKSTTRKTDANARIGIASSTSRIRCSESGEKVRGSSATASSGAKVNTERAYSKPSLSSPGIDLHSSFLGIIVYSAMNPESGASQLEKAEPDALSRFGDEAHQQKLTRRILLKLDLWCVAVSDPQSLTHTLEKGR